jgi:uncharacterized protein (UPF0276 family)
MKISQLGVGLQYSPHISHWFPFAEQAVDVFEILLDALAGPLDSPYVAIPGALDALTPLREKGATLLAHSNYGGEFGFAPLEETVSVRRHVPLARMIESPWVSDHCFYAEHSWADVWSSPVQFSHAELGRVADRARRLQDIYRMPLLHENAAYYMEMPGGEMSEAEFLARLVESADTYLHLDLHNVYTNSVNLPGYRCDDFLNTIPMERVVAIHLAGGSYARGFYHDWHDSRVPEPVWEMLERVLRATRVGAVILEFQGRAHHETTRELAPENDLDAIVADLERAKALWDRVYGPGSRRSTRAAGPSQ